MPRPLSRSDPPIDWQTLVPSGILRISVTLLQGTPAEGAPALNVLRVVEMRPIPPNASGKPECPKSSNQPVSSGAYARSVEIWSREFLSESADAGRAPGREAPFRLTGPTPISASGSWRRVSSIRSLAAPGCLMIPLRPLTVGTESRAKPRSRLVKGWSLGATGRVALMSGWTSSRAARRLTAVVLNCRMKSGSCPTAEARDCCWAPIVPSMPFRFATREEISGLF